MTKSIPLSNGMAAIVDDDMYDYLNQWHWTADFNKGNYYAVSSVYKDGKSKQFAMHSIVAKTPKGMHTDHINRNSLDNRRENLRVCTASENARNSKLYKNNKTGYRGVSWSNKAKRYKATIKINGKTIQLGCFNTTEEAARAYDEAAKKLHGEFAATNF